jgi:oligoribonuclease (3'-5' exoribonuclease)
LIIFQEQKVKELTGKFNAERQELNTTIEGLQLKIIQQNTRMKMLTEENESVIAKNASRLKEIEKWNQRYHEAESKYIDEIATLRLRVQSTSQVAVVRLY